GGESRPLFLREEGAPPEASQHPEEAPPERARGDPGGGKGTCLGERPPLKSCLLLGTRLALRRRSGHGHRPEFSPAAPPLRRSRPCSRRRLAAVRVCRRVWL